MGISGDSVKVEINLDQDHVDAGHSVTGQVLLSSCVPVKIRSLTVQLIGISRCIDFDNERPNKKMIKSRYFICAKRCLVNNQMAPNGQSSFSFCLTMPSYCPSTCQNRHGIVMWKCGAQLYSDMASVTEYKKFTVQGRSPQSLETPANMVKEKVLGGEMTLDAQLDKDEFQAGETMQCKINLDTKKRQIRKGHIELIQKQTFTAAEITVESGELHQELCCNSYEHVLAKNSFKPASGNGHVTIPHTAISSYCFDTSNIHPVMTEYYLRIRVNVGFKSKVLEMNLPFIVSCDPQPITSKNDSFEEEFNLLPSQLADLKHWIRCRQRKVV